MVRASHEPPINLSLTRPPAEEGGNGAAAGRLEAGEHVGARSTAHTGAMEAVAVAVVSKPCNHVLKHGGVFS
jgi:hypothetical protein